MRPIRAIWLSAALLLALSAGGVASASASQFTAGKYLALVQGTGLSTWVNSGGNHANCDAQGFETELPGASGRFESGSVSNADCTGTEGNSSLSMNGCRLIFYADGTMDIGPTGCGPIVIKTPYCEKLYPPQKGMSGVSFSTEGGKLKVVTEAPVQYSVVGSTAVCGKGGSGIYESSWTLSATDEGGVPTSLQIGSAGGVFVSGGEFQSETYPTAIWGQQGSAHVLTVSGGRTIQCNEVSTAALLSAASSQLTLDNAYYDCTSKLAGITTAAKVVTNTCDYTLSTAGSGQLGVACGKGGDGIEITVYSSGGSTLCTYKIAAQSGHESVGLETLGSGSARTISAAFNVSGLSYTRTSGPALSCGAASSTASYAGTSVLHG